MRVCPSEIKLGVYFKPYMWSDAELPRDDNIWTGMGNRWLRERKTIFLQFRVNLA